MHLLRVSMIGAILAVVATANGLIGTSTAAASGPDRSPTPGWILTGQRPPGVANAAGGVSVVDSQTVPSLRIIRYDAAQPESRIAMVHRRSLTGYEEPFIEPDGTIVVTATERHSAYAIVWPAGGQAGRWFPILRHVPYYTRFSVSGNASGSIAVVGFSPRRGVGQFTTYDESTGWGAQRALPDLAIGTGALFELTPDGRLDGVLEVSHDDGSETLSLVQMPLDGTSWATRDVLYQGGRTLIDSDVVGSGRSVAFNAQSKAGSVVGMQTAAGVVHTMTLKKGESFGDVVSVDSAGSARFILVSGTGADRQAVGLTFDAQATPQWQRTTIGAVPGGYQVGSDSSGDALLVPRSAHLGPSRVAGSTWDADQSPQPIARISNRRFNLAGEAVHVLDSGETWIWVSDPKRREVRYLVHPAA